MSTIAYKVFIKVIENSMDYSLLASSVHKEVNHTNWIIVLQHFLKIIWYGISFHAYEHFQWPNFLRVWTAKAGMASPSEDGLSTDWAPHCNVGEVVEKPFWKVEI